MDRVFGGRVRTARQRLDAFASRLDLRDSLPVSYQCLLVALLLLLLPTRRIGAFVHANFYAEDAQVWFAQAYSGGWLHSLTLPEGGYLNTLQRLLTGVALLVPFHLAPLTDAVLGLLVQVMPVPLLLSRRCRNWGPLSVRCLFAALYVCFPNGSEIYVVVTNSQWHLVLFTALLAFAEPPRSIAGKVADAAFFLLAGFCGPYGIVLVPVLLALWLFQKENRWMLVQAGVLCAGAAVQGYELLHAASRVHVPLGATPVLFFQIIGGDVLVNSMVGGHWEWKHLPLLLDGAGLCVGLVLIGYAMRHSTRPLKALVAYASLLLAAGLQAPRIEGPKPLWQLLSEDVICRYWFLPGLAFLWCAAWCLRMARAVVVRRLAAVVLLLTCGGILLSWRYTSFSNRHFPVYARIFEAAPPGTHVWIPIHPTDNQYVELVKH